MSPSTPSSPSRRLDTSSHGPRIQVHRAVRVHLGTRHNDNNFYRHDNPSIIHHKNSSFPRTTSTSSSSSFTTTSTFLDHAAKLPGVRHVSSFLDTVVTSFLNQGTKDGEPPTGRTARGCPLSMMGQGTASKKDDLQQALKHATIARDFADSFKDTTFTAGAGTPQEHIQHIYSYVPEESLVAADRAASELHKGIELLQGELNGLRPR
ncbi:unnamed protein product [Amoebophrya sp. A25]|nr:unnamed protein product [Amoebophrya sp. A25]|eukprot:GSA25T00022334001.1